MKELEFESNYFWLQDVILWRFKFQCWVGNLQREIFETIGGDGIT